MRYRLTYVRPNPNFVPTAPGEIVTQGALPHASHVIERYVCGDQDDVDRFIREHLPEIKEVRITPCP